MADSNLTSSNTQSAILVTGGAGFIGSHTCVELLDNGYAVVVLDDLSNSSSVAIDRVREITGASAQQLVFVEGSILDRAVLTDIFTTYDIGAIIHFAGFKAVGESVKKPLEYYWNNVAGTITLCDVAREHGCKSIVFSSSATVYGGNPIPYVETMPLGAPSSPYGWSKAFIERILIDLSTSDPEWNVVLLRYFNPVGAHKSGRIGEDPEGIPNNLMPFITQVAVGKRPLLHVFGGDYETADGTCERDFIHVVDLAKGHVAALEWMQGRHGAEAFNLGSGKGTSVMQLVTAFGKACGHDIPYVIDERREGDLPAFWADATKAKEMLGWQTQLGIDEMCEDSWRWQSNNPDGYGTTES